MHTSRPAILSLSTEFPNPTEPGKGLFVRARLLAMAAHAQLVVVSPVALLDYANPHNELLASFKIPRHRLEQGIQVEHPRWFYPPRGGWTNAFFLAARLLWPAWRLRGQGYRIIDAHYGHPEGIAAALLGAALGMPFIVTLRGSELRYRQRSRLFWLGWALRRADRVISVSNGLRDLAVELGVSPGRTRVIPNGIKTDVFHPRDRAACRLKHGIPDSPRMILSAGDLAELKGHHRIIRTLDALVARNVDVLLVIAGGTGRSGRFAATIREEVTTRGLDSRVRFAGEVKQESLAELMSAADVFCLASSSEGWPNVVNEALACGTPVVATRVGAVPQMLPDPGYGLIVPVDDQAALADALHNALTTPRDRAAIAAWGGQRSWEHVAEEVISEVRQILAEGASRRRHTT